MGTQAVTGFQALELRGRLSCVCPERDSTCSFRLTCRLRQDACAGGKGAPPPRGPGLRSAQGCLHLLHFLLLHRELSCTPSSAFLNLQKSEPAPALPSPTHPAPSSEQSDNTWLIVTLLQSHPSGPPPHLCQKDCSSKLIRSLSGFPSLTREALEHLHI